MKLSSWMSDLVVDIANNRSNHFKPMHPRPTLLSQIKSSQTPAQSIFRFEVVKLNVFLEFPMQSKSNS